MTVKHTPAPWWTTDSGVRDRGGYICHTLSAQHYPGQEERFARETAERAANKALIAAAPDLLEAAQAAWNCIGELPPTQARVEVAQLLQAAIEKAIGEQP